MLKFMITGCNGPIVPRKKHAALFFPVRMFSFQSQMEAIVFIILQIFVATRADLKIGEYLTIRPVALEGRGSNCFSITQLVGQKR